MYLPVNIPSGVSLVVWRALWCIFGENKRPRVYPVSWVAFWKEHYWVLGASQWAKLRVLGEYEGAPQMAQWVQGSVSWLACGAQWASKWCILAGCPAGTGLQLWLRLQRDTQVTWVTPHPLHKGGGTEKKTQERLKPGCTTKRDTRTYINVPMGTQKKTDL